jgi:hypothetical protein
MKIINPPSVITDVNPLVEAAMDQVRANIQGYAQIFQTVTPINLLINANADIPFTSLLTDYTGAGIVPELTRTAQGKIYIPPAATGRWQMAGDFTSNLALLMDIAITVLDDNGAMITEGRYTKVQHAPIQTVTSGSSIIGAIPDVSKTRTDTGYTVNFNFKTPLAATISQVLI